MRSSHSIATVIFSTLWLASGCSDGNGSAGAGGSLGNTGGHGGSSIAVPSTGGSGAGLGGLPGRGGSPGLGGVSGAGGASTGTTGSIIPADCNIPACYADLMAACAPSGTCVSQNNGTTTALCYSDGSKVITSLDLSTFAMAITFKKNGAVCMSMVLDSTSTTNAMTIKDGSGKTVGTIADSATGDAVVTCASQPAVTINQACDTVGGASSMSSDCTAGTCTP